MREVISGGSDGQTCPVALHTSGFNGRYEDFAQIDQLTYVEIQPEDANSAKVRKAPVSIRPAKPPALPAARTSLASFARAFVITPLLILPT